MTTLAALVAATPAATRGVPAGFVYGTGTWRFVVELADPSAGSGVQWYDITAITDPRVWTGYDYTRGADAYLGRYRASVVTLDLFTDDDSLAPWNGDTSPTFGVHVDLGPGLLIRAGFILVSGGVVTTWNPRFTCKVEFWGDASYSKGKVRQHKVIARDTMTSLVNVPLPARAEENWSDRMYNFLIDSGWQYGSAIYGAQFTSGAAPIKLIAARPAVSSAVNELDVILDPVGLIWHTNRLGQLVVRPRIDDTFHRDAFLAGATGNEWSTSGTPVSFAWWACEPDAPGEPTDTSAYAVDTDAVQPFGFDKSEENIYNHVVIETPASGTIAANTFDDDDPVSVQRYDRKTFSANWIAANDVVAAQILETRRNAVNVAHPLTTTNALKNFFPGPANIDFLDYTAIQHRNQDDGLTCFGNGWLRYYRERVRPLGCNTEWTLDLTVDVFNVTSGPSMLPVENLHLVGKTSVAAEFRWTDPHQVVIPTHTQYRLLNPSSLWITTSYPGETDDAILWGSLTPDTKYTFQVRLLRIVSGVITDFSPMRQISVRTDEPTEPVVEPGDGTVKITPPRMGVGCALAWQLQVLTPPSTWTDVPGSTYHGSIVDGDHVDVDTTALDPDKAYRIETQEFCGGIGGAINYTPPFAAGCQDPDRVSDAPFTDAIAYWPQICGSSIEEAISNEPMTSGPAYGGLGTDAAGNPVMKSLTEGNIGYGIDPSGAVPDPDDDLTIACRIKFGSQPTGTHNVFVYGGLFFTASASGAGFKIQGNCNEDGSGITTIFGTTVLSLNTEYDLAIKHDMTSESLYLRINGQDEVSALGSVGGRFNFGLYEISAPANSWVTDCAVWDRVLDDADLPGWYNPLLLSGWWGLAYNAHTTYNKTLVGDGVVKLAGAAGYGAAGGALVVTRSLGDHVVSIGESGNTSTNPNSNTIQVETWGYGGWGGSTGIYGDGSAWTIQHGGGRTELRTSSSRADAVLIAPGGGGSGGIGGFPDGSPVSPGFSVSGSDYGGKTGSGGKATTAGIRGGGYRSYNEGGDGDNTAYGGSGLGCGGAGGNGNVDFGSGGGGCGGGAGKHGGGGGSGGNGSFSGGGPGGGGSGDTSGAASVIGTYSGVSGGLGLAALQAKVAYSLTAVNFLNVHAPRCYIPGEEAVNGSCIVVSDLVSGKAFWDREAATIFDGTAASPLQRFQGYSINARGAMHVSRNSAHAAADFQCRAADATSGLFWNPPALNGSADWAIEWTQQTISGNADGPGAASVTTAGNYGNATANQIPWKVAATATGISLSLATTSMSTVVSASSGTLVSRATTLITRYGISYNHATDTFSFYRSDGVTATQTRTAASLPTSGQWNAATYRPLIFSSLTSNAESRIQDVALFDTTRSQSQFMAGAAGVGMTVPSTALAIVGSITHANLANAVDLALGTSHAFIIKYSTSRFTVVDISTPSSPSYVTSITPVTGSSQYQSVIKDGNYCYIADVSFDGVRVIDVSTPTSPSEVAQVQDHTNLDGCYDLVKSGNYIYTANQFSNRMTVIDATTPTSPSVLANFTHTNLTGEQFAIAKSGNTVFVAVNSTDRLTAIDVTTPSSPSYVGSIQDSTNLDGINDVQIVGTLAFCTSNNKNRLTIVDVSNPASMSVVGSVNDNTVLKFAYGVAVDSGYAFVTADANPGYASIVNVNTPASPWLVGGSASLTHTNLISAEGIKKSGNLLYIAGHSYGGLLIVQVT